MIHPIIPLFLKPLRRSFYGDKPKICIRSRKPDVRGVKTLEGLKRFNVELGIQRDIGCRRAQERAFPNHADWIQPLVTLVTF